MGKFSTPIIDFEKLPATILDWLKPRLMQAETVRFCAYEDHGDRHKTFTIVLITNQRLIILDTDYDLDKKIHYYNTHEFIFLSDVYQVVVHTHPQTYIRNDVTYFEIQIRYGGDGFLTCSLEPQVANVFELEFSNAVKLSKLG